MILRDIITMPQTTPTALMIYWVYNKVRIRTEQTSML